VESEKFLEDEKAALIDVLDSAREEVKEVTVGKDSLAARLEFTQLVSTNYFIGLFR